MLLKRIKYNGSMLAVITLTLTCVTGCPCGDGSFFVDVHGQIVETGTNEPISSAAVSVRLYDQNNIMLTGFGGLLEQGVTAISDQDGMYSLDYPLHAINTCDPDFLSMAPPTDLIDRVEVDVKSIFGNLITFQFTSEEIMGDHDSVDLGVIEYDPTQEATDKKIDNGNNGAGNNPPPDSTTNDSSCTLDSQCDDGLFCNGNETCQGGLCMTGLPRCIGILVCNEATDQCETNEEFECAIDTDCDDGLYCNGVETCFEQRCEAGIPICPPSLVCNEETDQCLLAPSSQCTADSQCDDGLFCNGAETCYLGQCESGSGRCAGTLVCNEATDRCETSRVAECTTNADCADEDTCTTEACIDGTCVSTQINCDTLGNCSICPSYAMFCSAYSVDCAGDTTFNLDTCQCETLICSTDSECDDGLYCNGEETCDLSTGCMAGISPCGGDQCDETNGCNSTPPTLRIVNDLYDQQLGDCPADPFDANSICYDWPKWNTIIRVRIGPTESSVVNYTIHERLWTQDYTSSTANTYQIQPSRSHTSYWDFDVSDNGPNYVVYIQTGWWDFDANTTMWNKHMSIVVNCDGTEAYKWSTFNVTDHTSGPLVVNVSDWLPAGNWYGSEFCQ